MADETRFYVRIPGQLDARELQALRDAGIEDGWPADRPSDEWEHSHIVRVAAADDADARQRIAAALDRGDEADQLEVIQRGSMALDAVIEHVERVGAQPADQDGETWHVTVRQGDAVCGPCTLRVSEGALIKLDAAGRDVTAWVEEQALFEFKRLSQDDACAQFDGLVVERGSNWILD